VSLTVFDHGDIVTLSSHFLLSPAENPHHFGGWICCRFHVERGMRIPFIEIPVTVQLATVEFSFDLGGTVLQIVTVKFVVGP
jgi:hypothetical protein